MIVPDLEKAGLRFVGKDETGKRMEILELQSPSRGMYVCTLDEMMMMMMMMVVVVALTFDSQYLPTHLPTGPAHPFFIASQFHPGG